MADITELKTAPQEAKTDVDILAKYGRVYRVGVTVPIDDDSKQEFTYRFKRPSVPSYDRYVKTGSKVGITQASMTFLLDSVIDEDKERFLLDTAELPGVGITIGQKLTEILGLTDAVNLKKL